MTRPIYEPSLQRTDRRLRYGNDQLFRRPSPVSDGGTSTAYLDDFLANGTGASVANDNWVSVVTGVDDTNTRWLNEFTADPNGAWSVDFDTGTISLAGGPYAFAAWGYVCFDVADGTIIGAEISPLDGAFNTLTVVDGANCVNCYAERFPDLDVKLRCYQASGGAADITEARLHVRQFEDGTDFVVTTAI